MQLIPVTDLALGCAVHARGGDRARYRPVESVLLPADRPGDALALVRSYVATLGTRACYAADLDAICGAALQRDLLRSLAAAVPRLWVDAGVGDADRARQAAEAGAALIVVGLETLRDMRDLASIVDAVGSSRTAFSLDLRDGRPMRHPEACPVTDDDSPETIAMAAGESGAETLIVLDVARVGSGIGADLMLLERLRRRLPQVALVSGGGVSGRRDLERLADAGCDAALVASAFHDGRLGAKDVAGLAVHRRAQSATSASR